jgi:hypothetical protein
MIILMAVEIRLCFKPASMKILTLEYMSCYYENMN